VKGESVGVVRVLILLKSIKTKKEETEACPGQAGVLP
jgi:hypothetical protein